MTDNLPARLVAPGPGGEGRTYWEVTPLGLQMIEELTSRGCHLTTVAKALGMHVATFREVRKRDPEAEAAYQRGLAREHDALVGNLRQAADAGNVVANLFLLKARHGYREGENAQVQVNVDTGGVLLAPPKMSLEQFLEERRAAGAYEGPRPETVERVPGQTIEGVVDPETRRGE